MLNFISSDKKRLEAFEVVDFGEGLGCLLVFIAGMSLLISADVTSVISSAVQHKIVLRA